MDSGTAGLYRKTRLDVALVPCAKLSESAKYVYPLLHKFCREIIGLRYDPFLGSFTSFLV
jgi:hypothetical protein